MNRSHTTRAIRRTLLAERMAAGPLSVYQLAELLGTHHEDLPTATPLKMSVRTLIDLSRLLDLHPADLIPELGPVLALRHLGDEPADQPPHDTGPDPAALLSALALARGPLSTGALCNALRWPLEKVHETLGLIEDDPDLASPLALRRTPRGAYTLAPRLDLLTLQQRGRVHSAPDIDAFSFTAEHTALLLAAITHGRTRRYADWRHKYHREHKELIALGALIPVPGAIDHVDVHPDVVYSLNGPDPA